jgi:hypothetical protein
MRYRPLAGVLAALLCVNAMPVCAEEPVLSGTCQGLDWVLEDQILTITGTGTLPSPDDSAWNAHADSICEIVIGEGITGADAYALAEYPALQRLTLPSTFTSLAPYALQNDGKLEEIVGLDYVTEFSFDCLSGTAYIAEHPYVITDGKLYYAECTGSTELTVPEGVTEIMPFAFGNLTGEGFLRTSDKKLDAVPVTVILPDSTEIIHDSAFAFCAGLTEIRLPDGLQEIGSHAFLDCAHLESLTLGENVRTIGEKAFYNCRSLEMLTVTAPDTVFGADAYGTCIDWMAAVESRGSSYESMRKEAEQHPCRLDEEMADFAVHFFGTKPYSRISYTDLEELTCRQGTLAGWRDSTARTFADAAALRFEALDAVRGDVDLNGVIDIMDVIALNKYLIGRSELKARSCAAADHDADGTVTAADALSILRCVLGIQETA